MEPRIAILCNPGPENVKALRVTDEASLLLKKEGIRFQTFIFAWPDSLEGFTAVWVVGGDGTLHHFINRYPSVEIPVGTLAGGSGNDFHWMLYGESTVSQQVARLLAGNTRRVDAGRCNDRIFLNGVGIGFDGAIVKDLVGKRKLAGKASYLLSVLKHILSFSEMPVRLDADGVLVEQDCLLLSIANGQRYGGGFQVAPKASLDDGLLDLNIVGRIAALQRMRYLPVIERGEHLELPFVQYLQGRRVLVESPRELPAHLDGEYYSNSRFEIEVLPGKFLFSV
ncbi:diacylglycerol/lipid kinase family protein [Flaviaesturariibacter amylovorans]|uniref:Diacylglycerol kinase family lipid kinase n=1 Tax=Flaviaesturariibacter amylovorans TaxID=1084520 RepID=A0ABP8GIL0_9BACT